MGGSGGFLRGLPREADGDPQAARLAENHTNVLMHIQGYFRDQLNSRQRGELREVILNYRAGLLPILAPLTLLKHYLAEYPDRYLQAQNYLTLPAGSGPAPDGELRELA